MKILAALLFSMAIGGQGMALGLGFDNKIWKNRRLFWRVVMNALLVFVFAGLCFHINEGTNPLGSMDHIMGWTLAAFLCLVVSYKTYRILANWDSGQSRSDH